MTQQKKSKRILFYFFLLFIVGSINNISLDQIKADKIKKINIYGLEIDESDLLLKNINALNLSNIFFLNGNEIKKVIDKNALVENYRIIKEYPATLNIKINKTKFLAKINKEGQTFFIGSNRKLIESSSNEELPFIFGKPNLEEFFEIKKKIDDSKISYENIKSLFFFQSKRWDVKLKNNVLLKLSKESSKDTIDVVYQFLIDNNESNIKMIDARVKNQIIVNE